MKSNSPSNCSNHPKQGCVHAVSDQNSTKVVRVLRCDYIKYYQKHIFRHRFAIPWRYLHQSAIDFAKARVHFLRSERAASRHKYYMQAKSIQLQRSKAVAHMPFNRFQHKWRSFNMTNGQKYIQLMFAMRKRKRKCTP